MEDWLELLGNVAVQAPVQNLFFTTFSVDILQFLIYFFWRFPQYLHCEHGANAAIIMDKYLSKDI